ncbi:MAG: magnesium/cobalt transporter CorA [Candidatus Marinimicrobia bacterium]|nr:magnesium/cobalt transporter CorA [Candidatus Neomarinimicrobiota bacterium]
MTPKYNKNLGMPPGTLTYIGALPGHDVNISVIDYNQENYQSVEIKNIQELQYYRDQPTITWINLDGIHNIEILRELGSLFDIHPLLLEDIVNTNHRPKLDEHDDQIFFTLKMLLEQRDSGSLNTEQVSIIIGKNYVISFQETPQDLFDQVRIRIKNSKGRIRMNGVDYLVYALVDAVVDSYFNTVDAIDEQVGLLEDRVLSDPSNADLESIQNLKKQLVTMRRIITPLREALGFLEKSESTLIDPRTRYYFRDVYDHILLVSDFIDASRDILNNVMDTFNSTVSNRMNQIMKVLTIIATIFIPLTFIAGVYGMNFTYMPELNWKWAYPAVLGVMFTVFVGMLVYFRKSKWL